MSYSLLIINNKIAMKEAYSIYSFMIDEAKKLYILYFFKMWLKIISTPSITTSEFFHRRSSVPARFSRKEITAV